MGFTQVDVGLERIFAWFGGSSRMVLESGFSCSDKDGVFLGESISRFELGFGDFDVELLQRTVNFNDLLMANLDDDLVE